MAAIGDGTIDQVQKLLGKHPETLRENGPLMLNYAAQNNRVDMLELLLAAGLDVDGPNGDETPLSAAAGEGAIEAAQWLLDRGANLNKKPTRRGRTPLHTAVSWRQMESLPPEVEQLGEKLDAMLAENTRDGQCVMVSQLHAFYHT